MTLNSKRNLNYPPVSIIILTYNGSEFIKPLLDSLLNQSYPQDRMEILVVDNASSDETLSIIRKNFSSVKVITLEKNIGYAAGNNQALLHASHDLLVFLNQDTFCHPGFLQSMVNIMEADKTLAACNPNIITPETDSFGTMDEAFTPESLYLCDLVPFGYGQNRIVNGKKIYCTKLLSGCAFIIRRETVSRLEYLFDDQLWMYAEDTDLSLRIHNMGQRICAVQYSIVYHLHNRNIGLKKNSLRIAARAIMNRVYAYFKNMGSLEFLLFFPLMFLGGNFKILEFPLTTFRKIVYFLPFSLFSMSCMILAILGLPKFVSKKRHIINKHRARGFPIFKLLLKRGR
jgi:GT2 family glycosyltransferase